MDKRCGNCEWYMEAANNAGWCSEPSKVIRHSDLNYTKPIYLNVETVWACDNHKPTDFTKWAELNTPREI